MNALADAARHTLAGGTARLRVRRFFAEPAFFDFSCSEGVTDLGARRARVRHDHRGIRLAWESAQEQWPWLTAPHDDDDEPEEPHETTYTVDDNGTPLWPLEQLAGAEDVSPRNGHYAFVIPIEKTRFYGEAWLDDAGRVTRVLFTTWQPQRPRTRRGRRARRPLWSVFELWDFGLPVDIPIPDADEIEFDPWGLVSDLGDLAVGGWRMFRRWRIARPRSRGERERGRRT